MANAQSTFLSERNIGETLDRTSKRILRTELKRGVYSYFCACTLKVRGSTASAAMELYKLGTFCVFVVFLSEVLVLTQIDVVSCTKCEININEIISGTAVFIEQKEVRLRSTNGRPQSSEGVRETFKEMFIELMSADLSHDHDKRYGKCGLFFSNLVATICTPSFHFLVKCYNVAVYWWQRSNQMFSNTYTYIWTQKF